MSLLEQSSSFSLSETESSTKGQWMTGIMRQLSGQILHLEEVLLLSLIFLKHKTKKCWKHFNFSFNGAQAGMSRYQSPRVSRTKCLCMSHQMSIMAIPGLIQLLTYERTCRCASAACRKSLHISSLAMSSARFSSLVVRHAALRLVGGRHTTERRDSFSHYTNVCNEDVTHSLETLHRWKWCWYLSTEAKSDKIN